MSGTEYQTFGLVNIKYQSQKTEDTNSDTLKLLIPCTDADTAYY